VSDDEIAVVCKEGSKIGSESTLLIIKSIELLIGEYKMVVFDVEQRCTICGTIYRTTALASELAGEDTIGYTLDYEEHVAFDAFFLLESEIGPSQRVDILFDALFEGGEQFFVASLNLVGVYGDVAFQFLSQKREADAREC
jgi:hypothetical protein